MKTVDEIKAEIKRLKLAEEATYGTAKCITGKILEERKCLASQIQALRWVLTRFVLMRLAMKTAIAIKAEIKRLKLAEEATYGTAKCITGKILEERKCLASQIQALRWVLKKSTTPL